MRQVDITIPDTTSYKDGRVFAVHQLTGTPLASLDQRPS